MGKLLESIDDELRAWIGRQHMFFVGTAPSTPDGHVNISPKGHADTFAVLGPLSVAYLDLTGSGIETVAHLRDNGRITVMFCAFEGKPDIVRLYGAGRVVVSGAPEWDDLVANFPARRGARAIVVVDVERVSTSCGFAIPLMDYRTDRDLLDKWTEARDDERISGYHQEKNARSIDGLPGHPSYS